MGVLDWVRILARLPFLEYIMQKVKDVPLGILFIVVSFFPLGVSYWLANWPDFLTWVGILLGFIIYNAIFNLGWKIAFEGVNVDVDNDKK